MKVADNVMDVLCRPNRVLRNLARVRHDLRVRPAGAGQDRGKHEATGQVIEVVGNQGGFHVMSGVPRNCMVLSDMSTLRVFIYSLMVGSPERFLTC